MDFHPDLHRERMAEERRRIERERLVRLSADDHPLRARVAPTLFRAAFAVDSGEVWRALWDQIAGSKPAGRNAGS